jgi:hypothetical protein
MATQHKNRKKPLRRASVRLQRRDREQPHPRRDYTVDDWCAKRRVSRFLFYKMLKAGTAPKTMKLNKRRTISIEADEAWQRAREEAETAVS